MLWFPRGAHLTEPQHKLLVHPDSSLLVQPGRKGTIRNTSRASVSSTVKGESLMHWSQGSGVHLRHKQTRETGWGRCLLGTHMCICSSVNVGCLGYLMGKSDVNEDSWLLCGGQMCYCQQGAQFSSFYVPFPAQRTITLTLCEFLWVKKLRIWPLKRTPFK